MNTSCWTTKPMAPPTTVMANGLDCAAPDYPYRSQVSVPLEDSKPSVTRSHSATSIPTMSVTPVDRRASTGATGLKKSQSIPGPVPLTAPASSVEYVQPAESHHSPRATYTSFSREGSDRKKMWWARGQGLVDGLGLFPTSGSSSKMTEESERLPVLMSRDSRSDSLSSVDSGIGQEVGVLTPRHLLS